MQGALQQTQQQKWQQTQRLSNGLNLGVGGELLQQRPDTLLSRVMVAGVWLGRCSAERCISRSLGLTALY